MTISAKVIADSVSPQGIRLLTFEIVCHRWILAEINTHRMLSRNFRSSRAVPVKKLIEEVRTNPAEPVVWLKNKPGMVGGEVMSSDEEADALYVWREAAAAAAYYAEQLMDQRLAKQWTNRVLEPFLYTHGVISGTDWANFYALRRHEDAQPEFKALADAMWEAQNASKPTLLQPGQWHLPYVRAEIEDDEEQSYRHEVGDETLTCVQFVDLETAKLLSAARCARVSLKPFDGSDAIEKELERAEKLLACGHMSPFEHQATPDDWVNPHLHGNLVGWCQHRKYLPNEAVKDR